MEVARETFYPSIEQLAGIEPGHLTEDDLDTLIGVVKEVRVVCKRIRKAGDEEILARTQEIMERVSQEIAPHEARLAEIEAKYLPAMESFVRQAVEGMRLRHIKVITGEAGLHQDPESVEFREPDDVLAWAKVALPDAVRIKESVDKKPVMAYMKANPNVQVPGAELKRGADRFYIK